MDRIGKKIICIMLTLAMCTALMIGATTNVMAAEEKTAEKLVYTAMRFPQSMDITVLNSSKQGFHMQVYEMLFYNDPSGEIIPWLADASKGEFGGYDHEDGTGDYVVYIYDYITDSQGNNIKASDVVFSYNATYGKGGQSPWNALESLEATGDYEITFHFGKQIDTIGELNNCFANCYIFSQAAYEASESQFATDACGTGVYTLTDFVSESSLTIEKREDYWQKEELCTLPTQQANVQTVVFQSLSEDTQKVIGLETGTIDLVEAFSPVYLTDFTEGGSYEGQFDIVDTTDPATMIISGNCSEGNIMSDINMRLAVFYAIDIDGLVAALGGYNIPARAIGSPALPDYNPEWEKWENYQTVTDSDLVKKYLDEAGYNGEKIRLACNAVLDDAAVVLQGMLVNAGINVEINAVDSASWTAVFNDLSAWDLVVSMATSTDYVVNAWNSAISTSVYTTGLTFNGIDDAYFEELLQNCRTEEGHTVENMNTYWQYLLDNAYTMGLYNQKYGVVFRNDFVKSVELNSNSFIIPGATTFS